MYHYYMISSSKFKILFDLYRHEELKEYLIPFTRLDKCHNDEMSFAEELIIRSALKIESEVQLNSGVGISINNINNSEEFKTAQKIIEEQDNFDFAIYQPNFPHSKHITVIADNETFYGDVIGDNKEFVMVSSSTQVGNQEIIKSIKSFLHKLKPHYSDNLLIEFGFERGELKVFQVMEVKDPSLIHFFYQELFIKAQQVQKEIQVTSLWQKMKMELNALKFRKSPKSASIANVLDNWLYIFHYYKLFCIKRVLLVGAASFESFLKSLNENDHILKMAKEHIKMASELRAIESLPELGASFLDSREIYLGKGKVDFILGRDAVVLEDLSFKNLIENKNRLILSTYNLILGHPCLYMAQERINFVGGLKAEVLKFLKDGDEISVDFNLRKIQVKSTEG